MEMTKLTIRIPAAVLERAKLYAESNDTSVTRLVSQYLSQLSLEGDLLEDAPITRRLLGALPPNAAVGDYQRYLDEKYGDAFTRPD